MYWETPFGALEWDSSSVLPCTDEEADDGVRRTTFTGMMQGQTMATVFHHHSLFLGRRTIVGSSGQYRLQQYAYDFAAGEIVAVKSAVQRCLTPLIGVYECARLSSDK